MAAKIVQKKEKSIRGVEPLSPHTKTAALFPRWAFKGLFFSFFFLELAKRHSHHKLNQNRHGN